MMLDSLEEAALRTLLLGAVAQLGMTLFRVKKPQLLLIAWTVVLAASLAMPALQWATPFRLPIIPALSSATSVDIAPPQPQPAATQPSDPVRSAGLDEPPTMWPSLNAIYLAVAGALLLRLILGIALSLRLLGKAVPLRTGWAADTNVRISRDITAPVTIATVILLPPDALDWPQAMRQAVLAHERAHVARWDFAMLLAAQLNRAIFWFSPLSWWLHRRLAALAELSSDDQAMQVTGDRTGYAAVLLEMGRRSGPLLRGLAMARPATVQYRIERILADRAKPDPVSPARQWLLAMGAASLSIAAASPQSTSGPLPGLLSPAGQQQPPVSADILPSLPAHLTQDVPQPMPVRPLQTEAVSPAPPQTAPGIQAAAAFSPPAIRAAERPMPQPAARKTLLARPPRTMVQQVRARNDQGARAATQRPEAIIAAGAAPQSQSPTSEPPLPLRMGEPACTGVYQPRPGAPPADRSLGLIQAKYFQESDGTSWVKFFVGERTRAMLTGREVERTSVRTTVVTVLPRGTDHLSGTTHGPYGTIDFECGRGNAHL